MAKRKYTELEIELYEKLAEIHFIYTKIVKTISGRFSIAPEQRRNNNKWKTNVFDELIKMRKVLKQAKIPKKFFIINSLENKNE